MAKATVEGSGKRKFIRPTKMVKQEVPFGGIGKVALNFAARTGAKIIAERKGAAILAEKAARITPKTTKLEAREIAAKTVGKNPAGKARISRMAGSKERAKLTVESGSGKRITRAAVPERAATQTEKAARKGDITLTRKNPKELKAAAEARKNAPRKRLLDVPAPSRNVAPRKSIPKIVRRARTVDQLGKSSASKIEKKVAAKQQAKLEARANRGMRPALIKKNEAAVRRAAAEKQAEKARQKAETRFFTDKTPVKQYADKTERVIGSTTKGELRQLKVKTQRAAANPENSLRGKAQGTIDERTPRPKGLTDKEVEILRKVGKRDYSKGEVNPLAQRTVQQEADRRVAEGLRDPRVKEPTVGKAKPKTIIRRAK